MRGMCVCCGELLSSTSESVEMESFDPLHLEELIEEARKQLSGDASQRFLGQGLRVGLEVCDLCNQAGCDGVGLCLVPPEYRAMMLQMKMDVQTADRAWADVEFLRSQHLQELQDVQDSSEEGSGDKVSLQWKPVGRNYWYKVIPFPSGWVVAEILYSIDSNYYLTRTQIVDAANLSVSYGGTTEWGYPTLTEAEASCEEQIASLTNYGPAVSTYAIQLGSLSKDIDGPI